jgi:4-hydroxy-tetrahydrodipicolinate synthase
MTNAPVGGIIPPMVSPLDAAGVPDPEALRSEVEYLLAQGVHGLCVTGSTGEGAALDDAAVATVARTVVAAVRGRVPVLGGVIRNSTAAAVRCAAGLAEAGVDGLQVTPVHYLFTPDADATVRYFAAVGRVGRPVYIYNVIPWAFLDPAVLLRVMAEVPAVRGVKQSGGDLHKLADLLAGLDAEHVVLSAVDDLLFPSFLLGAHGAIAAVLTCAPRLAVRLWDACRAGRIAEARRLHAALLPVWRALEGPNMPARLKVALALQGRRGGLPAEPQAAVTDEQRLGLAAALQQAEVAATRGA